MKKTFLILLFSFSLFAQETEFKFTQEGFTDYLVTDVEGKSQEELYKKALDWVAVTYKNPKEVIKAQIENDYIRIEGSSQTLVLFNILGKKYYDSKYQIEISFKEGKYKFDVISVDFYVPASQYASGGWSNFEISTTDHLYNKKGDVKGNYKYIPESFTTYFNNLNKELSEFLKSGNIPSKSSDW